MGCGPSKEEAGAAASSAQPITRTTNAGNSNGVKKKKSNHDDDKKYDTQPPPSSIMEGIGGRGDGTSITTQFRDPNSAFQSFLVRDKDRASAITPKNITTNNEATSNNEEKDGAHHVKNVFARPLEINDDYKPPCHEKSKEESIFIADALQKNFVFENLDKHDLTPLVGAFEKVQVPKDEIIIKQGDEGDWFYIILKGSVSFIVDEKAVGKANKGNSFGELALLYTCPRAATVQALESTVLFRVDQTTFRYILQSQTRKGARDKVDLLLKIPFLRDLPDEDVAQLTAVMTPHKFKTGEYLMRKGDAADNFYIVQEGTLVATNIGLGEAKFEDVTINPGDYVGERALVTGDPRAADVVAKTDGLAFYIDKDTFERVLGKLNDVIIRAQDQRKISSIKIFRDLGLDTQALKALSRLVREMTFKAGDVIIKEGDPTEAALYLVRPPGKLVLTNDEGTREEQIDGNGFFGEDQLKLDAKMGKNDPSAPSRLKGRYTVTATEGGTCGVLRLADCRLVFDTLLLGKNKKELVAKNQIPFEKLQRHTILGAGTFGQVWLVSYQDPTTGEKEAYALKIQSKYDLLKEGQAKAVMNEKYIMSKLRHPFIINMAGTYQDSDFLYMLLGIVQGGELFSLMHTPTRDGVPESQAKFYASCIAEGLAFMHRRGFVYRDLKPENVLIGGDGFPVIVDFGFAKFVKDKTYTLCGTPLYLPPEVILNRGHNSSADHWSLGVLIYEMIAGGTPFYRNGMAQMDLFRSIVKGEYYTPPDFSMSLSHIVSGFLTKNPGKRLGSLVNKEDDIYNHQWFSSIDFQKLRKKQVKAPYKPKIKDPLDASNFEDWSHLEDKTAMKFPKLSPEEEAEFKGF